jgi:hypothetical protein
MKTKRLYRLNGRTLANALKQALGIKELPLVVTSLQETADGNEAA